MRIAIRLGGHTAPWRFRDGDRLGDWIASRPWHTRSEVRVVRLARPSGVGAVFDAIQQAVVGADQGTTEVQCMHLNPQQVKDAGFEISLARRLGVSIEADRYAMIQAVARRLTDRPRLCLVPPLEEHRPSIAQDAEGCVDLLAKVVAGARACVLFADTRDRPLAGVAFDLTVGIRPRRSASRRTRLRFCGHVTSISDWPGKPAETLAARGDGGRSGSPHAPRRRGA